MRQFGIFRKGFTLIELLIVVAIIAILAAIAVPNFLEAQVRAKVSRAKSDMRTIHTALEAYKIDTNKYPKCTTKNWVFANSGGGAGDRTPTLERLTTPISYLNGKASFYDPFNPEFYIDGRYLDNPPKPLAKEENRGLLWYTARNAKDSGIWNQTGVQDVDPYWWFLQASGPDRTFDLVWDMINQQVVDNVANQRFSLQAIYDPTNGTISRGSIYRAGGVQTGNALSFYNAIVKAQ